MPPGIIILQGANAQGKTNLLEAIYLLATGRSLRAVSDKELIHWGGSGARLAAQVNGKTQPLRLEVVLREDAEPSGVKKLVRINGVPRRAWDIVGQLFAVMFTAQDIDLVAGPPALRRRYMDIACSQVDFRYRRALQVYQKVLLQRNHLLRRICGGEARPAELAFWDTELVAQGSYLMEKRRELVDALSALTADIHRELAREEGLEIVYLPSLKAEAPAQGTLAQTFSKALLEGRGREVEAGMTLVGPHRDDLGFRAGGVDMAIYGSRGQQRTVIQSLKLAEAHLVQQWVGETPIMLLDDVLSELDEQRRNDLLESISFCEQVFITATDLGLFPAGFLGRAARLQVRSGGVERL